MTSVNGYLTEISPPGAEPLSLEEAKEYLRVTSDGDDRLILGLISAARMACEDYTGRALIMRDCSFVLDVWPGEIFVLPRPPLVAVERISVYDAMGVATEISAATYSADGSGRLAFSSPPLSPGCAARGIDIRYKAGYGSRAADVPAALRTGMKQVVARLYENRGDAESAALPASARALFQSCRVMSL